MFEQYARQVVRLRLPDSHRQSQCFFFHELKQEHEIVRHGVVCDLDVLRQVPQLGGADVPERVSGYAIHQRTRLLVDESSDGWQPALCLIAILADLPMPTAPFERHRLPRVERGDRNQLDLRHVQDHFEHDEELLSMV